MKYFVLTTFVLLLISIQAQADIIQLKSGIEVDGQIVERTSDHIMIDTGLGVPITYYLDEIESLNGQYIEIESAEELDANKEESGMQLAQDHYDKSWDLFKQKKYSDALREIQSAIEISPEARYYYSQGQTYEYMKMIKEGKQSYKRAIEMDPNFVDAYYALGVATCPESEEVCIRYINRVIELDDEYVLAHSLLGRIYLKRGNNELAKHHLNKAHQLGYELPKRLIEFISE